MYSLFQRQQSWYQSNTTSSSTLVEQWDQEREFWKEKEPKNWYYLL